MTRHYTTRPFNVEAIQWTDTNAAELTEFAGDRFMTIDPADRGEDPEATAALRESWHETWELLVPGTWVVKRQDGRFFPLGDGVFRAAYMRADLLPATVPDRTTLREHIRLAIARQYLDVVGSERAVDDLDDSEFGSFADAVLSVLPPPADRAAVLLEFAGFLRGLRVTEIETELRRLAAEAQQDKPDDRDQGGLGETRRRERGMAQDIVSALGRKVVASAGVSGAADEETETVHACPPDGSGLTPCCGRTPFELPLGDRISSEAPTTCPGVAVSGQPAAADTSEDTP